MKRLSVRNFDLKDTLECGQTFCWIKEEDGYINADLGGVVYVEQQEDALYYESNLNDVDLVSLLRLDDPIEEIQAELAKDDLMAESIEYAPGLRIVSDPFFPCLVSFICSTWKNIPSIKQMTQGIREKYGPTIEFRGKTYHGMPSTEELSRVTVKELEELSLGYRAKFIVETTTSILEGEVNEEELRKMNYSDAHSTLKTLHGVGDKVADCVSLFSLGFLEAFPIDVWIERVIQKNYGILTEAGKSYKRKSQAAREYFGKYAGYAQEYLYYYTRESSKRK